MPRGGKREGSGRKPSEKTQRVSVPLSLLPDVESMINKYKNPSTLRVSDSLAFFLNKFPQYENDLDMLSRVAVFMDDWEELRGLGRHERKLIIKLIQEKKGQQFIRGV